MTCWLQIKKNFQLFILLLIHASIYLFFFFFQSINFIRNLLTLKKKPFVGHYSLNSIFEIIIVHWSRVGYLQQRRWIFENRNICFRILFFFFLVIPSMLSTQRIKETGFYIQDGNSVCNNFNQLLEFLF